MPHERSNPHLLTVDPLSNGYRIGCVVDEPAAVLVRGGDGDNFSALHSAALLPSLDRRGGV